MGIMDVLGRYAQSHQQPHPEVLEDFDRVSRELPPETLGAGLEDAFRSDATPPFEQMVGQLYHRSPPEVRAGLLGEIFGSLRGKDPREVHSAEVEQAAREEAQKNPSVIERVSRFYANHPQLVQTLGQAAVAIAMNGMARRRRM